MYNIIVRILKGEQIPKKRRGKDENLAYMKISRHKYSLKEVCDPLTGEATLSLLYRDRIVPRKEDVKGIVTFFYEKSKGGGVKKLNAAIRQKYAG